MLFSNYPALCCLQRLALGSKAESSHHRAYIDKQK